MADAESSQASVIAETVTPDMESSQQSTGDTELTLSWQPVRIAGAKGATHYWIVELTKVCSDYCMVQMMVYLVLT